MSKKGFINAFFQNCSKPEGFFGRLLLSGMNLLTDEKWLSFIIEQLLSNAIIQSLPKKKEWK